MNVFRRANAAFSSVMKDFGGVIGGEFWSSLNYFGKIVLFPTFLGWWLCSVCLASIVWFFTLMSKE